MKKILFTSILAAVLIIASVCLYAYSGAAEEEQEIYREAALLQEGKLLPEPVFRGVLYADESSSLIAELDERLYAAFKEMKTEVDINDLKINYDDFDDNDYYGIVINNHPDCFYVLGRFKCTLSKEDNIRTLKIYYSDQYDQTHIKAFYDTADRILSGVNPSWDDERKALYLHDYLVTHCQYDLSLSKRTAYDAIVGGESVCQGYALAYQYLCGRVGIQAGYVSSKKINHAWNIMKIDGFDYYTDCTWDDPCGDSSPIYKYYCSHEHFLLSREAMYRDHNYDDWIINSTYEESRTSDKYDSAYWSGADTPVLFIGDTVICSGGPSNRRSKLISYDYGSGESSEICDFNGNYYYESEDTEWMTCGFGVYMARYGSNIIAATADSLYCVYPDGSYEKLYSLIDDEDYKSGGIMGFMIDNGVCFCDVYNGMYESDFQYTVEVDLSEIDPGVLIGDVNNDGYVLPDDQMILSRWLAGWEGYGDIDLTAADIDEDGEVTLRDAILLARWLAGQQVYSK